MILFRTILRATSGWRLILAGDAGWRERFTLSRAGLVQALVVYLAFVLAILIIQSAAWPAFSITRVLSNLLVQCLPLVALFVATSLSALALRWPVKLADMLVPGVNGLVLVLITGTLISLVAPSLASAVFLAFGAMLFRAGRVIARMGIGSSIAFALLAIALLVGLPTSLYMLTVTPGSPI